VRTVDRLGLEAHQDALREVAGDLLEQLILAREMVVERLLATPARRAISSTLV